MSFARRASTTNTPTTRVVCPTLHFPFSVFLAFSLPRSTAPLRFLSRLAAAGWKSTYIGKVRNDTREPVSPATKTTAASSRGPVRFSSLLDSRKSGSAPAATLPTASSARETVRGSRDIATGTLPIHSKCNRPRPVGANVLHPCFCRSGRSSVSFEDPLSIDLRQA